MKEMVSCPTRLDLERYLARECAPDRSTEIEEHASSCSTCGAWLEEASADEELLPGLQRALDDDEGPATRAPLPSGGLARYRILRRIGSGGMGIVWEAEQKSPRRRVALKLLRSGLLSERTRARFESEAAFLGRLEHPCIARIFEADTFEKDGEAQQFFAMELVDGRPLDRWASEEGPSIRAKLRLFLMVCDAIQHAHQRGVLHRDLKPANILVTADGTPKVVDFGIARATEEEDPDAAQLTEDGQLVGTLAYMSPEQVARDTLEVDTRADVYALGVVLYELLAGRLPIDVSGVPMQEALRRVAEERPVPLASIAAIDRDLETITTVALAKERERRYPSVEALAADLRRWLRREPISARPPSRAYLTLRFVQRNRALVGGLVLTFATLVVGLIATGLQARRARIAEQAANERGIALQLRTDDLQERTDELQQRTTELQQRSNQLQERTSELETESARLAAVLEFLVGLLGSRDPDASVRAQDFTVREALDVASEKLAAGEIDDPEVEATLRFTLGNVYRALDDVERAAEQLERSIALLEEHAPGSIEHVEALNALGALHYQLQEFDRSEELWLDALAHLAESDEEDVRWRQATVQHNLAVVDIIRGEYDRAEMLLNEALEIHREVLGPDNHTVANDMRSLALVYARRGEDEQAEQLYRDALAAHTASPDPESLYTANARYDLGGLLITFERWEEAEEEMLLALEIFAHILGPDHPRVLQVEREVEQARSKQR